MVKRLPVFLSILLLGAFFLSCDVNDPDSTPDGDDNNDIEVVERGGHTDWSYNLSMYEVNIRQYTPEGTFAAFEEHLDRLEEMGIGILWIMPIHPIGEENRLETLGSYYSVKDYRGVNPEFGTHEDFESLVEKAHSRGMYVILDWVPNHTAWDNYLTEENPHWYETDSDGNFMSPPGTNWSDVIQLDHSEQGLQDYMVEAMEFWVEDFGVDGFRVDAASFVDDDFQENVNNRLRAIRPDIFLLAEDDGPKWYDVGYDMSHGWGLYGFGHGVLIDIADGNAGANELYSYYQDQVDSYPEENYRLYFTQNHDENSWYGTTSELFGEASEIFAVLTATFHGMPLIYSGQEAGLDQRLEFFEKDEINWRDHPKEEIYSTLIHLKRENQALWNGEHGGDLQRVSTQNDDDLFVFVREKEGDRVFVALNLSDENQDVSLSSDDAGLYEGEWLNVFSGDEVLMDEGTNLSLSAWDYAVYEAK